MELGRAPRVLQYPQSVDEMLRLFADMPKRTDVTMTQAVIVEICRRLMAVEAAVADLTA